MTASVYLDALDEVFRPGLDGLHERFTRVQVEFIAAVQQADGGFCGRRGGSDPYYTDFALRTLAWLAPEHVAFDRAAGYLARQTGEPRDAVACFNRLNARRLIERRQTAFPRANATMMPELTAEEGFRFLQTLDRQRLPCGGFARTPGDLHVSAYHTFLAALCFPMLGMELSAAGDVVDAVASLRQSDGGYAELAGQTSSQTSATAAAVALLVMHDVLQVDQAAATARFLADMQSADGGWKAHAAAPGGDLLSTFTGLLTLQGLGQLSSADTVAAARFVRRAALPGGGFLACAGDDRPDVEYTYYGVGLTLMLRATLADHRIV